MTKKCSAKTEVYSRIVGYFRPVQQWNPGKQEEFKSRVPYKQPGEGLERLGELGYVTSADFIRFRLPDVFDDDENPVVVLLQAFRENAMLLSIGYLQREYDRAQEQINIEEEW